LYQNVLSRAPGVLDEDEDGNPNVHGARSRDFRAEVAGVSNVDPLTGEWLSYINADSIEELEIIPLGAGVEFGRAQGGFARVLQKQGTNRFEGVFGFLYQSSALDGQGSGASNLPDLEFETLQPSLQISGPLIRDKLWYRLSHEYLRRDDPINLLSRTAVSTLEQTINADQLTWQVSPRNKLIFQYQSDPLSRDNLGISTAVQPESSQTFERNGQTYSVGWVAPLSPDVLLDSTVAYQNHRHDLIPTDPDAYQYCVWFFDMPYLNQTRCHNLTANVFSGPHNETSKDERQRFTVRTQATLFGRLFDQSHQLKLGFIAENERYTRELIREPQMEMTVIDPPLGDAFGIVNLHVFAPRASDAEATGNSWALYGEDQWRPTDGLSVTLGLRYDREEIDARGMQPLDPQAEANEFFALLDEGATVAEILRGTFTGHDDVPGLQDQLADALRLSPSNITLAGVVSQSGFWYRKRRSDDFHIVNNNLSPRLTVAWDPWRNGKTKFGVSAGRYYDKIFLAVPLVELEPLEARDTFTASYFWSDDVGMTASPLTVRTVDRDLDTPYQDELTLSFERELWQETALRLSYVHRSFKDQLQDVEINHHPADHGRCVANKFTWWGEEMLHGEVATSPGEGQTITDPFTGEQYVDTDPGAGDGRLDDCVGELHFIRFALPIPPLDIPDGRPDPYVQNPAWEEIFVLGNFNSATYEAVVLELIRRQFHNWELQASYTWSCAVGDAEDFNLLLGDEQNLREDERGYLDYDQRHAVKVNFTTLMAAGFRAGLSVRWDSGLPYSLLRSLTLGFTSPPDYPFARTNALRPRLRYPTGQRNDQRNESYWTVDLRLAKDFSIGRRVDMQLSLEAFNLLNDTSLTVENSLSGEFSGTRRFGRRFQLGLRLGF